MFFRNLVHISLTFYTLKNWYIKAERLVRPLVQNYYRPFINRKPIGATEIGKELAIFGSIPSGKVGGAPEFSHAFIPCSCLIQTQ